MRLNVSLKGIIMKEKIAFIEKVGKQEFFTKIVDYYMDTKKHVYIEAALKIKNKEGKECSGVQLLENFNKDSFKRINDKDDPEYFI